jgi:hypothetical protein
MKMRTIEEMHKDLRNWEMEAGESFLDYFGASLNEFVFMIWCHGKGYITGEQLLAFESDNPCGTGYLYGDEEYSVVQEIDNWEVGYQKAFRILSEFLCATETYQTRVDEFLKQVTRLSFEEVLKYRYRDTIIYVLDGMTYPLENDTHLTLDIISKAKWYRDDSK